MLRCHLRYYAAAPWKRYASYVTCYKKDVEVKSSEQHERERGYADVAREQRQSGVTA